MKVLIRLVILLVALVAAGCAVPMRNQAEAVAPAPVALMAPAVANQCDAPTNQGCNSCQIDCPANMIAFCAPGRGRQVLTHGGIYVWQCSIEATCSCSYPQSKTP